MSTFLLDRIYIYPIKSLAGIRLSESLVQERGLAHDRRWMLIDAENQFLSQRTHPEMALLQPSLQNEYLEVVHRLHPAKKIAIPLAEDAYVTPTPAKVWGDEIVAFEAPPLVHQWFSKILGQDCRLVYMKPESHRPVDPKYVSDMEMSFADGYPFLLANTASLDFLNQHLQEKIGMDRFRPNLVFIGTEAFQEDNWSGIQIGKLRFRGVKPCARCQVITINQDTLQKQKEVTTQLAQYRRAGNKVLFGENLVLESEPGLLTIGESLQILSQK